MPTQIASDDFDRADASTLGANWTDTKDYISGDSRYNRIVSNKADGGAGGGGFLPMSIRSAESFSDDQYSTVTLVDAAALTYVGVRGTGDTSSYLAGYGFGIRSSDGLWVVYRFNGDGTRTLLDSGITAFSDSNKIWIEITGSSITGKIDTGSGWTTVVTVSDGTYTTGKPWLSVGSTADDWAGGNVGAAAGQPTMRRWGGVPYLGGKGIGQKGTGRMWGRMDSGLIVPRRFQEAA